MYFKREDIFTVNPNWIYDSGRMYQYTRQKGFESFLKA